MATLFQGTGMTQALSQALLDCFYTSAAIPALTNFRIACKVMAGARQTPDSFTSENTHDGPLALWQQGFGTGLFIYQNISPPSTPLSLFGAQLDDYRTVRLVDQSGSSISLKNASNAGTASWFYLALNGFSGAANTTCITGDVTGPGGGGDLIISNTTVAGGQQVIIDEIVINMPTQWTIP